MSNPYTPPQVTEVTNSTVNQTVRTIPDIPLELDTIWCIKQGWSYTVKNFGKLFIIITLPIFLSQIVQQILDAGAGAIDGQSTNNFEIGGTVYTQTVQNFGFASFFITIISMIIGIIISAGVIRASLKFIDTNDANFSDLFSDLSKLPKLIGATLLFSIAVGIGFLLLLVPGIYLVLRYGYFFHAIIDKDLGVFDSFKYSSELTRGSRLNIFVLGLLAVLIALAGMLALLVGLLWAIPVTYLAYTIAYCYMHQGEDCLNLS